MVNDATPLLIQTGVTNAGAEGTKRDIKPSPVTPTASATRKISGYAPAASPPDETADTSTQLKFKDPS